MKALADLVIEGKPAADIGTDHGFVPIHLIVSEKVPFVIMTDINEGPLGKAQSNLNRVGVLPQYYSLRLGDGLEPVRNAEVSSIVIAGLGAETIIEILEKDLKKTKSFERLILQPRKRPFLLREWLYDNNFIVNQEVLIKEDGKLCEIISASPSDCPQMPGHDDYYLPEALYNDPLFSEYLDVYIRRLKVVIDNLKNSKAGINKIDPWVERLSRAERLKNVKQGY